mgnify:CR=1 FL=1
MSDLAGVINGFRKNETDMPGVANSVVDVLDRGWHYATLFVGEAQIRTGHVLVAGLKSNDIRRTLNNISQEFAKINVDGLLAEHRATWSGSEEENLQPMDGSGLRAAGTAGAARADGPKGTTPLDRYSQDLTAKAKSGEKDPILGRDDEIRHLHDVLMRRHPHTPTLTGDAGLDRPHARHGCAHPTP